MENPYDDIISLPHHTSERHPHLPMSARAAQFAPFAALAGHKEAIQEAARGTTPKRELAEDERELLNRKLQALAESLPQGPEVEITYFRPDEKKEGGAYVTAAGRVQRVDSQRRAVLMEDGTRIPIEEIVGIEWG